MQHIPYGRVVSYGQVAAYVGVPRGARQVGWTLRRLEDIDIPWWRVINNEGRISILWPGLTNFGSGAWTKYICI